MILESQILLNHNQYKVRYIEVEYQLVIGTTIKDLGTLKQIDNHNYVINDIITNEKMLVPENLARATAMQYAKQHFSQYDENNK